MKKTAYFLFLLFVTLFFTPISHAIDTAERVRVIKYDKVRHDLIVERITGERLLLQHNRVCGSMTTEFPVYLLWTGENITKLKVAANEICKVYNFGKYENDVKIIKRIKSPSPLIKEHIAEIEKNGAKYEIDYGDGCSNLRNFIGDTAYISSNTLKGAELYLPGNRGQCTIKSANFLGNTENPDAISESPIKNIQYKAENNQAYFYWDKDESDKNWLYVIAKSRYKLDTDDYGYKQMPGVKFTRQNEYTMKAIANNVYYYFYLSAVDEDGNVAPWTELKIKSIITKRVVKNNPDPEEFEISISEDTDEYFTLIWPDKSKNTRRYLLQFFVNGKREFLKIINADKSEYRINKKPEYKGAGFRFTVRSIPKNRFGARYYDGIFWRSNEDS